MGHIKDNSPVFNTSSSSLVLDLGKEIQKGSKSNDSKARINAKARFGLRDVLDHRGIIVPRIDAAQEPGPIRIIARCYSKSQVIEADKAKADIIYYDIGRNDFADVKKSLLHARLFAHTPRMLTGKDVSYYEELIKDLKPDGILVGDPGLLSLLAKDCTFERQDIHLDYSFNCFNDIDISCHDGIPILSPELSLDDMNDLNARELIVLVHGDIILMTSKEPIKAPEIIDEEDRHFRIRISQCGNAPVTEILNSRQLGLFNNVSKLKGIGIKYFYLDTPKDIGKYVRIYRSILEGKRFDDKRIRKGFTTGHLNRGAY